MISAFIFWGLEVEVVLAAEVDSTLRIFRTVRSGHWGARRSGCKTACH
jgi:hypothetical protein